MGMLLADNHEIIRGAVRKLLETRADLHVVAEASTGREALEMVLETKPNIAILDYRLPGFSGRDLIVAIKQELPNVEVLIYTMIDSPETMLAVLRAGAIGFVHKTGTERHLFAAIDALAGQQPYFTSTIADGAG